MTRRRAGVLLHPSSLPGRFGIGDLGPEAERFLAWAQAAGQSVWQVLPLGPTAHGDSPYACLSAFAGNTDLISPERLVEDGLLTLDDLEGVAGGSTARIDHETLARKRTVLLEGAFARFERDAPDDVRRAYRAFVDDGLEAPWLDDWCLFAALKARHGGIEWLAWDPALRRRERNALARARKALAADVQRERFWQFVFFRQWARLRDEARSRDIELMGDVPIYVALDSADVWAHQDLFHLDAEGRPTVVAGVPPDYFSETGQLWGNPIYRWDRMAADGFAWWVERMRQNARLADLVRIDHFRGFAAYWEVEAGEPTAVQGRWVPGPGAALFEALRAAVPELPIVAEDLGHITPDVRELRERCGMLGMKVLQFGFDEPDADHAPHRCSPDTVAYTGTHDNDTTRGWFDGLDESTRRRVLAYTGAEPGTIHWGMIRVLCASAAELAVVPFQDVLGLGSEARMNVPGRAHGHWQWRIVPGQFDPDAAERLRAIAEATGRVWR